MLSIRPATAEDVGPLAMTVRAWVIEDDIKLAVMGYCIKEGQTFAWAEINPEWRSRSKWYARDLFIATKKVLELVPRGPLYAMADADIPGSRVFMEHLGFSELEGEICLTYLS